MDELSALEERLRRGLAAGSGAREVLDAIDDLTEEQLNAAAEHDFGRLLVLTGAAWRLAGQKMPLSRLHAAADRYAERSIRHTGRIIPRMKAAAEMIERSCRADDPALLIRAADEISQGWPGFTDSAFPTAFRRLAKASGMKTGADDFRLTSYTAWRQGVAAMAAGDFSTAARLFDHSLDQSRRFGYWAEASWLHADLVMNRLLAGDLDGAGEALAAQYRYLRDVRPGAEPSEAVRTGDTVQLGEVTSGPYRAFVDSIPRGDGPPSPHDLRVMRRYVTVSENLIAFATAGNATAFDTALDAFTFGWSAYHGTAYPVVLATLAGRYATGRARPAPSVTAHRLWIGMAHAARLPVTAAYLDRLAAEIRERLLRAGLDEEAAIALLDVALLHALTGRPAAATTTLARNVVELRDQVPGLLRIVAPAIEGPDPDEMEPILTAYIAGRARYGVPGMLDALADLRRPGGRRADLHVRAYGDTLFINGVRVLDPCPRPMREVLTVLATDVAGDPAPYRSSTDLAKRTGRSPAAIVQTIRRLRLACISSLQTATDHAYDKEILIQGRPGYRLNPATVTSIELDAPS